MEDNRYHSSSQGYSSDYKPSGYTDFSSDSKSYNYQSDDYYKNYDDFSSYSSESQNKSYEYQSFQSNPTSFYSDQNNFSSNKDYNQRDNNQTDWNSSYESQYKKTPHELKQQALNHYEQQVKRLEASKTKSDQKNTRERAFQGQQQAQFQQPNPNRRFTVRDVLQMPLSRQQYLRGLQIQNLRLQPQFKAILQRPNVVLGIADYYEKIIPDKSFTKEVGSIKMGKDYKEILWLTSMLAYFFLKINQTQISQSKFFKFIKGPKGFIIPTGLTFLLMMDNNNTRKKTANLVFDPKNQPYVNLAVRKFICDTSYKERVQIFGQT